MPDSARTRSDPMRAVVAGILTIGLLAAGAGAMFRLSAMKQPPVRETAEAWLPVVRLQPATYGSYRERLEGYGRARAMRQGDVIAEVAGVVSWISPKLEAGSEVDAGEVLIKIDPRDFELALKQSEALRRQAESELERTRAEIVGMREQLVAAQTAFDASKRELDRAETLANDDLATKNEVDILRRATELQQRQVLELKGLERATLPRLDWGQSDIARHQAAADKARLDVERATIEAPFSGRVEQRLVEVGERVTSGLVTGEPLCRIIDLSRVEVPVSLPGSRFGEVLPGATASLRLREGGAVVWTGKVVRVAPAIDPSNRTFDAYLEVEGDAYATSVAPGAFVLATIDGMMHDRVVAVPRGAFVEGNLYLARPDDDASGLAAVELATPVVRRMLVDTALVESGLAEGDLVVVSNLERVAHGSRVRLPATDSAAPSESGTSR